MKTKFSKAVSLMLAFMMTASLLSGFSLTVSAADDILLLSDVFDVTRKDDSEAELKAKMEASLVSGQTMGLNAITKKSDNSVVLDYHLGPKANNDAAYSFGYKVDSDITDLKILGTTVTKDDSKNSYDNLTLLNFGDAGLKLELSADGATFKEITAADYTFTMGAFVDDEHAHTVDGRNTTIQYTIALTDEFKQKLRTDAQYTGMRYFKISVGKAKIWRTGFQGVEIYGEAPEPEPPSENDLTFEKIFKSKNEAHINQSGKDMAFYFFDNTEKSETNAVSLQQIDTGTGRFALRRGNKQTGYLVYDVLKNVPSESRASYKNKSFIIHTLQQQNVAESIQIEYTTQPLPDGLTNHTVASDALVSALTWEKADYTVEAETEQIGTSGYYSVKYVSNTALPEDATYIRINMPEKQSYHNGFEGITLVSTPKPAGTITYSFPQGATVQAQDITTNTATVFWPAVTTNNGDLTSVQYQVTIDNKTPITVPIVGFKAQGLSPDTTYNVSVSAIVDGKVVAGPITGSFTTEAEPVVPGQTSVKVITYDKTLEEIFAEMYDCNWDGNKYTEVADKRKMFVKGHVKSGDIDVDTLTREAGSTYNKSASVTYAADNMTSFEVDLLVGRYGNKIPVNATFEVSKDGKTYTTLATVVREGADPLMDGDFNTGNNFVRWTYTGYNIPTGTKYLRINLPIPVEANKTTSAQLEKVKINQNALMDGWGSDAKLNLEYPFQTTAKLSWPALQSDEDFEYVISNEYMHLATVDKNTTEYTIEGLEQKTEYRFEVAAVVKNDDTKADMASILLLSDIIATGGSKYILVDQFKFADSWNKVAHAWEGDGAPPVWDADKKTVYRKGGNGSGQKSLSVIYLMEEGLQDFTVDFTAGNVGGKPNESTFQVSIDGVQWLDVPVTRAGADPASWDYETWTYTPTDANASIPKGTKYLKIIFGTSTDSSKRTYAMQLKKVVITRNDIMKDDILDFDIADYLTGGDTVDSVKHPINFPNKFEGKGIDPDTGEERVFSYPVKWISSDKSVIDLNGQVHEDAFVGYKKEITLTAELFHDNTEAIAPYTKEFTVKATRDTNGWTAQDYINYEFGVLADSAAVTAPSLPNEIYTTVRLPKEMEGGCSYSWSVSKPEYGFIDERGNLEVTLDLDSEATFDLILKATKDGVTAEKRYPITLLRGYGDNVAWGNATVSASSNSGTSSTVMSKGWDSSWTSAQDDTLPYLQYAFASPVKINTAVLGEIGNNVESFVISVSNDRKTWTTVTSGTAIGDRQKVMLPFNEVETKYVRAEFTPKAGATVQIACFEVYGGANTVEQVFTVVFDSVKLPRTTSTDLDLPTTGIKNAQISWESSDSNVISKTGKVTRPTGASKTVTLTMSVTYQGETRTKVYEVTVLKEDGGGSNGGGFGGGSNGGGKGNGNGLPYIPDNSDPVKPEQNADRVDSIYNDVAKTHWAYGYIKTLTDKNIVSGSGDNNFYPESSVTREEFLKMLLCAMGVEVANAEVSFRDVDSNAWYAPYVATAYKMGIVNGIDETAFGIGTNIARQDMAVMTARLLKARDIAVNNAVELNYQDASDISSYATEAVSELAGLKIMNGDENNLFLPTANATRAEASKIVYVIAGMAE